MNNTINSMRSHYNSNYTFTLNKCRKNNSDDLELKRSSSTQKSHRSYYSYKSYNNNFFNDAPQNNIT
jgi:hypothetical protein